MYFHKLEAGLNAAGELSGWRHVIVGQSIVAGTPFAGLIKDGKLKIAAGYYALDTGQVTILS